MPDGGERNNPGPSARGCEGSRCERGTYGRAGMRLREPRRHVQVIPCIRIRRRLCLLSNGGVNDGAGRCRYPVEPMRLSRSFVPTLREDPAEAEIASHRLLAAGRVRAAGDVRGVHDPPARPADDAEDRDHRPRGDGRGRLAANPDADRASGRSVEGDRPLRPLRGQAVQADGSSRSRAHPRPHAGGGRRAAGGRRPAVLPRPAEERLPGRVEVPRRVPAAVRAASRARVPDEGRVFDRPRRGRHARRRTESCTRRTSGSSIDFGLDTAIVEADPGQIGGGVNHEFLARASVGEDLFVECENGDYRGRHRGCPAAGAGARRRRGTASRSPRSTRRTRRRSSPWRRC